MSPLIVRIVVHIVRKPLFEKSPVNPEGFDLQAPESHYS